MRFVIRYAVTNALRLLRETLPLLLLTAAVSLGITVSTALERQSEAVFADIESRYKTVVSLVSGMETEPVVFIGVTEYAYADAPAIVQECALHVSDGVKDGRRYAPRGVFANGFPA